MKLNTLLTYNKEALMTIRLFESSKWKGKYHSKEWICSYLSPFSGILTFKPQ